MEHVKKFIECIVPVTICNLKCSYCYVIQENRRTEVLPVFLKDAEFIGHALSKERLGGTCYISICGAGETLIPKEMTDIVRNILAQGHYVNITTNGTISKRFDEIALFPMEFLLRLHLAFSLHYLELKHRDMINVFFSNIQKMRNAGCSFTVQFNLCDEYIPYLEEIDLICRERVGAPPQVAATRDVRSNEIKLLTKLSREEYYNLGSRFHSPLFDFTMKNFMVKRNEFCCAGAWSFNLNLCDGDMKSCYDSDHHQNIYEDINRPIVCEPIGKKCNSPYCGNSSHFMSLGIIPSISTPSYARLRNRMEAGWYTPEMDRFLNGRLYQSNLTKKNRLRATVSRSLSMIRL